MNWKRLFATKSLERLHEEMLGENRLRRILGPVGLNLGAGIVLLEFHPERDTVPVKHGRLEQPDRRHRRQAPPRQ